MAGRGSGGCTDCLLVTCKPRTFWRITVSLLHTQRHHRAPLLSAAACPEGDLLGEDPLWSWDSGKTCPKVTQLVTDGKSRKPKKSSLSL